MDKPFDFSKFDNREEFRNLQKEEQEKIVGEAQEDAEKINNEIDRLTDEIINNKRKAGTARSDAAREVYEEKIALYETELQQIKQENNKTDQEEEENMMMPDTAEPDFDSQEFEEIKEMADVTVHEEVMERLKNSNDNERFETFLTELPSNETRDIFAQYKTKIAPLLTQKDIAEKLIKSADFYKALDPKSGVSEENVGRYLHKDTITSLPLDQYKRDYVNSLRLKEILDAILSRPSANIEDVDFVLDIIHPESNNKPAKNKFLRNLALKKAVDIFHEIDPAINVSDLYTKKGAGFSKKDFLFTLPLLAENGQMRVDLLETVKRYQQNAKLRIGSARESIYFSALADLYNPSDSGDLITILETLKREYVQTQHPDIATSLHEQEIFEKIKKCVLTESIPGILDQISTLGEEDRQEFIDLYFYDIWDNLPQDEKRKYWDKEMHGMTYDVKMQYDEFYAKDEKTDIAFEAILKKISAIRLTSPKHAQEMLAGKFYSSIAELNRAADLFQIKVFEENFEFNSHDRQILEEISDFAKEGANATLASIKDKIPAVFEKFGDLNSFLILMERYRQGPYSELGPVIFRKNVVPLLKEFAYHVIKGDFNEWRANISKSIQGVPLEYKLEDKQFWDTWNTDNKTDVFHSPMTFSLEKSMKKIDSSLRFIFADPNKYLINPKLWKSEMIKNIISGAAKQKIGIDQAVKSASQAIGNNDVHFFNQHNINPKDQAHINRSKRMIEALEACSKLCSELNGKIESIDSAQRQQIQSLISAMRIDEFLEHTANERYAKKGFQAIKKLQSALAKMKILEERKMKNEISVTDSSDPYDLITVGQQTHTLMNCTSYQGDPNRNAFILDIATSKNKKVIAIKERDEVVARAIAKILRTESDPNAPPIIIIDDILTDREIYDYKNEMIEHFQKKFEKDGIKIAVGEGLYDDGGYLKKIQEMAEEIRTGKINFDELTQEDQENMENFQKRVVIGWGTGSKVSAELVETPPNHTMPHHPIIKSEPKKSTDKTPLRTAFYKHFVKILN